MIKVNKYKLYNEKIKDKLSVLLIADTHIFNNYNDKLLDELIEKTKILKPSIICLCGDIIDEFRFLNEEQNIKYLLDFLNKISFLAPTFITLGSHDYLNTKKSKNKTISSESIKFWHKIIDENNNSNLMLLDNQVYENSNIRIIGYTNGRNYFKEHESSNILVSEINEIVKNNFSNDKLTILMSHSPKRINKAVLSKLNCSSTIDLILSGHMHDGLVFPILKKLPTHIGIVGPSKKPFPMNARGKKIFNINNHKINLIITGGFIKFSNTAPKIFQKFNFLYNHDIDFIE